MFGSDVRNSPVDPHPPTPKAHPTLPKQAGVFFSQTVSLAPHNVSVLRHKIIEIGVVQGKKKGNKPTNMAMTVAETLTT